MRCRLHGLHGAWLLSLMLLAGGCASQQTAQVESSEAEDAAVHASPFLISEAKRPEGWPDLTPVGEIQVKQYPAYRAAFVSAEDAKRPDQNSMFMVLFNHIKAQKIAMTAPVEMTYADQQQPTDMAFVYRDMQTGRTGPDGVVQVRDIPAATMLSIGVRGKYTDERLQKALDQLTAWLDEHDEQWQQSGPPRYLGYNSPFVPWFMRYGEVQVPIGR